MAEKKLEPIAKLSPEQKKRLEVLDADIERAEIAMNNLKDLGVGVDQMREHLEWAKKTRQMLLDNFT